MFEAGLDQAAGLRGLFRPRTMRLLPIVADEQAIGSAVFAVNLAAAMAGAGHRPLVIDAHRNGVLAQYGLDPRRDLCDLISGHCSFAQAVRCTRDGVSVLPAQLGLALLTDDPLTVDPVFSALASLQGAYDVALLHAPATSLGPLLQARDVEIVLLCGPDEQDLTDTYSRVKSMVNDFHLSHFRTIFRGCLSHADAALRHRRLASAASRFLEVDVAFGGALGLGADLEQAARDQTSVFALAALGGQTARAFERIAAAAFDWRLATYTPDHRTIH